MGRMLGDLHGVGLELEMMAVGDGDPEAVRIRRVWWTRNPRHANSLVSVVVEILFPTARWAILATARRAVLAPIISSATAASSTAAAPASSASAPSFIIIEASASIITALPVISLTTATTTAATPASTTTTLTSRAIILGGRGPLEGVCLGRGRGAIAGGEGVVAHGRIAVPGEIVVTTHDGHPLVSALGRPLAAHWSTVVLVVVVSTAVAAPAIAAAGGAVVVVIHSRRVVVRSLPICAGKISHCRVKGTVSKGGQLIGQGEGGGEVLPGRRGYESGGGHGGKEGGKGRLAKARQSVLLTPPAISS